MRLMVQLPQEQGTHRQQPEGTAAPMAALEGGEGIHLPETVGGFRQAQCNYRREKLIGNNSN